MDVKALLANKTFLYVVLGVSVASLFGYVVGQRTNAVLFFILAGYVTSHFSKNMTVILLVPLLMTNFVFSINRMREGLESRKKATAATDAELEEAEGEDNDGGAAPTPVDIGAAMAGHEDDVSEDAAPAPRRVQKKKVNARNNQSASSDDAAAIQPHPEVDKKKTQNMAFSYLDSVLGEEEINNLTNGMDRVTQGHAKLEKMIEAMEPLIGKATAIMDKMGSTDLAGVENMMKKMGGLIGNLV